MLWVNGGSSEFSDGHAFYHAHPFNAGQHIAHNAMLDECVRLGIDWHIRMDDDCFISTRTWLRRLLDVQERHKKLTGRYSVLGVNVQGLDAPPPSMRNFELGREVLEHVEILGGIFRMSPMPLMRYFRWDERQAMGYGDATQFKSYCESVGVSMFRVRGIKATHGISTQKQNAANREWEYQHDMDQFMPLGL